MGRDSRHSLMDALVTSRMARNLVIRDQAVGVACPGVATSMIVTGVALHLGQRGATSQEHPDCADCELKLHT